MKVRYSICQEAVEATKLSKVETKQFLVCPTTCGCCSSLKENMVYRGKATAIVNRGEMLMVEDILNTSRSRVQNTQKQNVWCFVGCCVVFPLVLWYSLFLSASKNFLMTQCLKFSCFCMIFPPLQPHFTHTSPVGCMACAAMDCWVADVKNIMGWNLAWGRGWTVGVCDPAPPLWWAWQGKKHTKMLFSG